MDSKTRQLQRLLIRQSYTTSPYSKKVHTDKSSGKTRNIMRPKFFPDQCIQWAVMQVVEPIILKGHYYHSAGSIPGKGSHFAAKFVKKWTQQDIKNTRYVLQIDITQYYPSIPHQQLKDKFRTRIKCKKTLNLLDEIISGGGENGIGLPIGNYTSQWFANFYLQEFDAFIKQNLKVKYYIRYMDDIIIFDKCKHKLHEVNKAVHRKLLTMELQVKDNWQIFPLDKRPLDFLGFKFYRDRVTIRKRNSLRIKRRAKKIYKKNKLTYRDSCAIMSYMGTVKHCDSYNFYHKNIRPYVDISRAKEVIRNESKK